MVLMFHSQQEVVSNDLRSLFRLLQNPSVFQQGRDADKGTCRCDADRFPLRYSLQGCMEICCRLIKTIPRYIHILNANFNTISTDLLSCAPHTFPGLLSPLYSLHPQTEGGSFFCNPPSVKDTRSDNSAPFNHPLLLLSF